MLCPRCGGPVGELVQLCEKCTEEMNATKLAAEAPPVQTSEDSEAESPAIEAAPEYLGYASFGGRFAGWLVDSAFQALLFVPVNILLTFLLAASIAAAVQKIMLAGPMLIMKLSSWSGTFEVFGELYLVLGVWFGSLIVILWLYHSLFESSSLRATPGKLLTGLEVVSLNQHPVSFLQASARYFVRLVSLCLGLVLAYAIGKELLPFFAEGMIRAAMTNNKFVLYFQLALYFLFLGALTYIGYLLSLLTTERQAVHGILSGSLVLRAKQLPVWFAPLVGVAGAVMLVLTIMLQYHLLKSASDDAPTTRNTIQQRTTTPATPFDTSPGPTIKFSEIPQVSSPPAAPEVKLYQLYLPARIIPEAREALVEKLSNDETRITAIRGLAKIPNLSQSTVDKVADYLKSSNEEEILAALQFLKSAGAGLKSYKDNLLGLWKSSDANWEIRYQVVSILDQMQEESFAKFYSSKVLPEIKQALVENKQVESVLKTARVLGPLCDPLSDQLQSILYSSSTPEAKLYAAKILQLLPSGRIQFELDRYLSDERFKKERELFSSDIKEAAFAAKWLGTLKVGKAESSLIRAVKQSPYPAVQIAAINALLKFRINPAIVSTLQGEVNGSEVAVRVAAIEALGALRIPDELTVRRLTEELTDTREVIREAAANALWEIGTPDARSAYEAYAETIPY